MQTNVIPKSTCEAIDHSPKYFWWGSNANENSNMSMLLWSSICAPKAIGNLGTRRTQDFNRALLAKLAWAF